MERMQISEQSGLHGASKISPRERQMRLARSNRVATIEQLSASIAHELKQPLGAVLLDGQGALNWLARNRPDVGRAKQSLERIIKQANRISNILELLHRLVRKNSPLTEVLNVNEAILELLPLIYFEAVVNRVSVRTQLAEGLPIVGGDRLQLQHVILNLVVNAIEAMKRMEEAPRDLLLGTEAAGPDGVLVAVRDTGPGLEPGQRERVFDAFYTTKANGMGMGLSICRSIIGAHSGRLWASANEPRGAVFQFSLPASSRDP